MEGRYLGRVAIPPVEGRSISVVSIRAGRVAIAAEPGGVPTIIVYDIVRAGDAAQPD